MKAGVLTVVAGLQRVARWVAVSVLPAALVLTATDGAVAERGTDGHAARATAADRHEGASKSRASHGPAESRTVTDERVRVRLRFAAGHLAVVVHGRPHTTYDLELTHRGALKPAIRHKIIRTGPTGRAALRPQARLGASRTGSVTVHTATTSHRVTRTQAASLFVRPTRDHGLVQATSDVGARLAAIRADHPSRAGRQAAIRELFRAPASSLAPLQVTAPSALASDQVEVRGVATWTDWLGDTHPARHIQVKLFAVLPLGGGYSEFDRTTTDDAGRYDFVEPAAALDGSPAQVEFDAVTSASSTWMNAPDLTGPESYYQVADAGTLSAGHANTRDITIGNQGAWDEAFAVTDAVWSAHLYAGIAGGGDEGQIRVWFPYGPDGHAETGDHMELGAWEWSAWDVINHEYGHYFDRRHGSFTSALGPAHCVDAHLASSNCSDPALGKDDGTRVAWSEGFANFYAISAAHYAAHPAIPGVGDGYYDDEKYDDHAVRRDDSFSRASDGEAGDNRNGEDNEMAVAGLLWNLERSGDSGSTYTDHIALGPQITMGLIENAGASRFSQFVQYIWPDDSPFVLGADEETDFGCLLAASEVAPYDVTVSDGNLGHVPTISWAKGNQEKFKNDSFVVQAFDHDSAFPYFTSERIQSGDQSQDRASWQPTGNQWNQIAAGHGDSVELRVTGWQGDGPATGPYRGCREAHTLTPGPIVSKADCQAVQLPANDDGSTAAVDLPFPVNFFGTTYTYLYVNNNGNVTFNAPQSAYTPFTIGANTPPMIAPLFADVDTRGGGSAPVSYGFGTTTFQGHQAFCVNWINVGYYAGHYDKLDSAQLLLVDRSDQGVGDFDIVFNYGNVQWETGDASGGSGGFGGTPLAVGYSAGNGDAGSFFQLPGSLATRELVDGGAHALSTNSIRSTTPGRYMFPVRSGSAGNSATGITGTVTSGGQPVDGARIQVCPHDGGSCVFQTRTSYDGTYSALGVPAGSYDVTAYPPTGLKAKPVTVRGTDVADQEKVTVDLALDQIDGLPAGTTLTPLVGSGDEPMVYWQDSLHLHTKGCPGGSASYTIAGPGGDVFAEGPMDADGQGGYDATVPPLYPHHGQAHVHIDVFCLAGVPNQSVDFDIYIDPAGAVVDQAGHPVAGATVTLERSDSETGPFEVVPDGSDLMSPANRANPTTTGETGAFGWDVVAGFYRVTAHKDGCTAPGGGDTVSTDVLPIPPEVTGLQLVLDCPVQDQPPALVVSPQTLEGNTAGGFHGGIGGVSVTDPDDDPSTVQVTNDAPAVLPLGTTQVTWTATDPSGRSATATQQVTVMDTTAPTLTCPDDVSALVDNPVTLGRPTVSDVVDVSPSVSNDGPAAFGPGRTTVTWRSEDHSGNAATCRQQVTVTFPFVGFQAPVNNLPIVNTVRSGQSVPVKFSLTGDRGLGILATGSPSSRRVACDSSAATDAIETTTSSQSGLQYDPASDTYTYVWKTDKAWVGTCRQLTVTLTDGTSHTALFQLR